MDQKKHRADSNTTDDLSKDGSSVDTNLTRAQLRKNLKKNPKV
jgi:hypothetical protein